MRMTFAALAAAALLAGGPAFAGSATTNLMQYLSGKYGFASQAACAAALVSGEGYHTSYPPRFAFDGLLTPDVSKRFIGNLDGTLVLSCPEPVRIVSYTLWRLSTTQAGYGAWRRAPTAWRLEARAAPGDDWTVLDSRSGIAWDGSDTFYAANTEHNAWKSFAIAGSTSAAYTQFRFVATASNYADAYQVGLNELVLFASLGKDEEDKSVTLTVGGVQPHDSLVFSPAPLAVDTYTTTRVARYAAGTVATVTAGDATTSFGSVFASWGPLPENAVANGRSVTLPLDADTAIAVAYDRHWALVGEDGASYVTDGNWKLLVRTGASENIGYARGAWLAFPADCAVEGAGILDLTFLNADLAAAGERPVLHLSHRCFGGASGVTEAVIPADIPTGSDGPFQQCATLKSLVYLGDFSHWRTGEYDNDNGGFCEQCPLLASASLPNATVIPRRAFMGCPSLPLFDVPASCTNIHPRAFREARRLMSVTGGVNLRKIGEYAFMGCAQLASACSLAQVEEIRGYAFDGCSALGGEIDLPSCVSLGAWCFNDCTSLASVRVPRVTNVPDAAFNNCTALREATLSPALASVGNGAFQGCSALTTLNAPRFAAGFSSLGISAFRLCSSLSSNVFVFPRSFGGFAVGAYGNRPDASLAFAGAAFDKADLSATRLGRIPDFTFAATWNRIDLPSTVTNIGYNAFGSVASLPADSPLRELRFRGPPPQVVDEHWCATEGRDTWVAWKMAVYVPVRHAAAWCADPAFVPRGAIADPASKPHYAEIADSPRLLGAWRDLWLFTYVPPGSPTRLIVE